MNLKPRVSSNLLAALIRPRFPSLIRSPSERPWFWYCLATLTTKRRLAFVSFSSASWLPFLMRLARSISSSGSRRSTRPISCRYLSRDWLSRFVYCLLTLAIDLRQWVVDRPRATSSRDARTTFRFLYFLYIPLLYVINGTRASMQMPAIIASSGMAGRPNPSSPANFPAFLPFMPRIFTDERTSSTVFFSRVVRAAANNSTALNTVVEQDSPYRG